jgi:hypothetical protein
MVGKKLHKEEVFQYKTGFSEFGKDELHTFSL